MRKSCHLWLLLLGILSISASAVTLKSGYPERYVVKEGDTLWDIAGKYLDKPWEWKEIWRGNPQIKNPKHLHPGAVLELQQINGKPVLVAIRRGVYKLSPQARPEATHPIIPTIPLTRLKPFLTESLVMDPAALFRHPYIAAIEGTHLIASADSEVFVRELPPSPIAAYQIFRLKKHYVDPETKEPLGVYAYHVGGGDLTARDEQVATLIIKESVDFIQVKDLVMPKVLQEFSICFDPRAPSKDIHGEVIDMLSSLKDMGTYQVMVVNRGHRDGLQPGDVLAVYKNPAEVRDRVQFDWVRLPAKRVGEVLIFRIFDKVSFGLVVKATEPIKRHYLVQNP